MNMATNQCKHARTEVLSDCCTRSEMEGTEISRDGYGVCGACHSSKAYFQRVCVECEEAVGVGYPPYPAPAGGSDDEICTCGHPLASHRQSPDDDEQVAEGHFSHCRECDGCAIPEVEGHRRDCIINWAFERRMAGDDGPLACDCKPPVSDTLAAASTASGLRTAIGEHLDRVEARLDRTEAATRQLGDRARSLLARATLAEAQRDALLAAAEAAVSRLSDGARDATEHGDPLWNLGEPGCDAMLWLEGAIRAAKGEVGP